MHYHNLASLSTLTFALASTVSARDVPSNVRNFYNRVKSDKTCPHELQGGFHGTEGGPSCR
jgi:hypothetical protein